MKQKPLASLRQAREAKGITQQQIAEFLGITASYYSYLEAGKRRLTLATAAKIAEYLNISIEDISKDFLCPEHDKTA
jgi:transcriptional regulator with XRE-family HTH domain